MRGSQRENVQAALALLLGPETADDVRQRALRRLRRHGADILPLVLTALSNYPEITMPEWPEWPPQYKLCARLLLGLSQATHLSLEEVLQHPAVQTKRGPVLWTTIIEASELERPKNEVKHEALLRAALAMPWTTVRYAAAMTLGTHAHKNIFQPATLGALHAHTGDHEEFPVRLAAVHALLHCGEESALMALRQLLVPEVAGEVRKAALFILAAAPVVYFSPSQLEEIMGVLLRTLRDNDTELALQAAHTLGKVGGTVVLPVLSGMLAEDNRQVNIAVLHALEDMAQRRHLRREIIRRGLLSQVVSLCRAKEPELRGQACHTLAAYGGEFATAVLATLLQDSNHPGHLEAIESLRMLSGALRPGTRRHVQRWLLSLLANAPEASQALALDTLAGLLWKAHRYQKHVWEQMTPQIAQESNLGSLLHNESAWVRQRALELLIPLGSFRNAIPEFRQMLESLLSADSDSGVRACAAYVCGQIAATWAIPTLILALLDSNEYVAQTALHALEQLASTDDVIVVYVMRELARGQDISDERSHLLAQEARQFLKKRRRSRHNIHYLALHGLR